MLLVAGAKCRQVGDTEAIHRQLHPRLSSIIKVLHKTMSPWCQVEDVEDPLHTGFFRNMLHGNHLKHLSKNHK